MSTANLEPTDVGPAVGGDLAVTPQDRDHVISLLNAAFSEGYLSLSERDTRTQSARKAEIFDDLIPLTRDLTKDRVPSQKQQLGTPEVVIPQFVVGAGGFAPTNSPSTSFSNDAEVDSITAIFGEAKRNGHWRILPRISVTAIFGGAVLDFSEAVFTVNPIEIDISCLFGGIELTVPEGAEVRNSVNAIFGGVEEKKLAPPIPGAPTLLIRGFALCGGVTIKHPKNWKKRIR